MVWRQYDPTHRIIANYTSHFPTPMPRPGYDYIPGAHETAMAGGLFRRAILAAMLHAPGTPHTFLRTIEFLGLGSRGVGQWEGGGGARKEGVNPRAETKVQMSGSIHTQM